MESLKDYQPDPLPESTYESHLRRFDLLDRGFAFAELVQRSNPRKALPPRLSWHRMPATLALANALRAMVVARGLSGLHVRAAYRPEGGASKSVHKDNGALDLDALPKDYDKLQVLYDSAVELWCAHGKALQVGLGLYCPPGRTAGIRVHLDTGMRCRTWQISGDDYVRPPVALSIAGRHGFEPPSKSEKLASE